jgi:membrane protein DedA with SNARE-associated domain
MTPFEHFVFVGWILTCVLFYLWEKKAKKRIKRHYKKKYRKKLAKAKSWKRKMGVDGE